MRKGLRMCFAEGSIQDHHRLSGTIGLGTKLVKETLPLVAKPYVEMIAVMAKYNPFAEKAGMKKILESKPNPAVLEAIGKLRKLGFNPVFLSSEECNMHQLRALQVVSQVKTILKDLSKAVGIYRKRLWSSHKAYMPKEEFNSCVDKASLKKWPRCSASSASSHKQKFTYSGKTCIT